jgi:hypothetical protein
VYALAYLHTVSTHHVPFLPVQVLVGLTVLCVCAKHDTLSVVIVIVTTTAMVHLATQLMATMKSTRYLLKDIIWW